jgi:hypothetical protein
MNIYWNRQNADIVPSLNAAGVVNRFDFFLRDTLSVNLIICVNQAVTNQPFGVTSLAGGESVKFGAKAAVTDADFLFSQATWVAQGAGDTQAYVADISLNTAELIAAIADADFLDVIAEWTIQNTSNENLDTTQVTFRIFPDVIKGTEGVPTSQFPVIQQYTDDSGTPAVRIVNAEGTVVGVFKNGIPYTFILSTGLWYPLLGSIVDGIPVLALGAGESV